MNPTTETQLSTEAETAQTQKVTPTPLEALTVTPTYEMNTISTEITLDDATKIHEIATKGEFEKLRPCGPVPHTIADGSPLLRVTADGEVEIRLPLQARFNPDIGEVISKEKDRPSGALNEDGREIFQEKLSSALGRKAYVENGHVFTARKDGIGFEKIGWLPLAVGMPERTQPDHARSRMEYFEMESRSPFHEFLEKGKDIVYKPSSSEGRNPEQLQEMLEEATKFFKAYVESVAEQSGGRSEPLYDTIAIRAPKEKQFLVKRVSQAEEKLTESERQGVSLIKDRYDQDGNTFIQAVAARPRSLWQQAKSGRLYDKDSQGGAHEGGVTVGPTSYIFSGQPVKIQFTPLGELRLEIALDQGEWGENLDRNGNTQLTGQLQKINELLKQQGRPEHYILEGGVIRRQDDSETTAENLAILPRDHEKIDGKKVSELREKCIRREIEGEQQLREEIAKCIVKSSNQRLVLTSGSRKIADEVGFEQALDELLMLGQAYLMAKGSTLQEIPPREQLVVKPLPEQRDTRPRARYSFMSLMFDAHEDQGQNELMRAIEAQEHPTAGFDDIIAQQNLVRSLKLFVRQLQNPEHFAQYGAEVSDAILLYGPPGNGKTTSAAALANSLKSGFINVSFKELLKSNGGNIEKHIKDIIKIAEEWAEHHPSGRTVLFLDEIDVHIKDNERFDVMLRTHLSGLERSGKIVVVAATNYPEVMSPGLRERFSLQIEAQNPEGDGIEEVMKYHYEQQAVDGESRLAPDFDFSELTDELKGYSSRRLKDIVNYSLIMLAVANEEGNEPREYITNEDIREATKIVRKDEVS